MVERKLEIFTLLLIYSISILYFSIPAHVQMIAKMPKELGKLRVPGFNKVFGWYGDLWTEKEFSFSLYLKGKRLKIQALAANPDIKEKPLTLFLSVDGKLLSSFELTDSQWKTLSIEIPNEYRRERKYISGRLSHTFVPRDYKINEDTRQLGLLIRNIWTE